MNGKQIVTAALLAFVAASVGYLIYRESGAAAKADAPADSSAAVPPAAAAAAAAATPAAEGAGPPTKTTEPRYLAYYFHGTRRCHTCQTIQAWSEEAIDTAFATDVAAGRLALRDVNIEETDNAHFATDFAITGSTLVIAEVADGATVRFRKLERTWDLVDEKPLFLDYVVTEIDAFLRAGPDSETQPGAGTGSGVEAEAAGSRG